MRIGQMKDRIDIYKPVWVQDEVGQPEKTWEVFCSTWAYIVFSMGKETINAERENWMPKASCRIRKRSVTVDMRIQFDGELYEITEILPGRETMDLVIRRIDDGNRES